MSTATAGNSEVSDFINSENAKNQVVVWSKSYCPYCNSTKQLFNNMGGSSVQIVTHELDQMSNGAALQHQLAAMTGQRSVPNVFVNGAHLGGNDDTQAAARNGSLVKLLEKN